MHLTLCKLQTSLTSTAHKYKNVGPEPKKFGVADGQLGEVGGRVGAQGKVCMCMTACLCVCMCARVCVCVCVCADGRVWFFILYVPSSKEDNVKLQSNHVNA